MWKSGANFLVNMIDVYSVGTKGLVGFSLYNGFVFKMGSFVVF